MPDSLRGERAGPTLHIIDPIGAGPLAVATLAHSLESGDATLLVGPRSCAARAVEAGIGEATFAPAPAGAPERAWRSREAAFFRPAFGRVHAWSAATLALARLAFPGARVSASILSAAPDRGGLADRWRQRVATRHADRIVFGSAEVAASWRVPHGRVASPPPPFVRRLSAAERAETRARWGAGTDTAVVGVIGDRSEDTDAHRGVFLIGALAIAGRPARAVVPAGARGIERARRLTQRQEGRWSVAVDERSPCVWLDACDAVLSLAGRNGSTPLAAVWAVGAGKPSVVETSEADQIRRADRELRTPLRRVDLAATALHEALQLAETGTGLHGRSGADRAAGAWKAALLDARAPVTAPGQPASAARGRWSLEPVVQAR